MKLLRTINLVIGYMLLTPGIYSVCSFFLLQFAGINVINLAKDYNGYNFNPSSY
jgi:hypothetical protein